MQAETRQRPTPTPIVLVCMALFTCAAFMANAVFPVLVDPLISEGRATLSQVGRIATADYLVTGVASLLAPVLLDVKHFRRVAVAAAMLLTLGNLLTMGLGGDAIIAGRTVAGVGGGVLVWLQYVYVSRSSRPGLLTGCFLAAFVVLSALVVFAAPDLILPRWGANGIYFIMAATGAAAGLWALLVSGEGLAGASPLPVTRHHGAIPVPAHLILWSVFFFTAFVASIWVYLAPIASANAVPAGAMTIATMGSLVMQAVGAAGSGIVQPWVSDRRALATVLLIGIAEGLVLLSGHVTTVVFVGFAVLLGTIGNAALPFAVGILTEVDSSRRSIEFVSAPLFLGGGFGPLASSIVMSDGNVKSGILMSLGWSVLALIFFVTAVWGAQQPSFKATLQEELP